ncbi:hypothetical protein [Flavipsychrobacter stenotrophus]|uniref:hypothetical protein n=1 Tax=Flavipsychrobacter stenotrophus TaxID=2077091 RepID=UPI001057141D|nr:hypothetical protein [Flavipsychrobacter stenotrophus]
MEEKWKKVEVFGNLLKHTETQYHKVLQPKHTQQNFRKQEKTSTGKNWLFVETQDFASPQRQGKNNMSYWSKRPLRPYYWKRLASENVSK